MARILIAYDTRDGHTAKVGYRTFDRLADDAHEVALCSIADRGSPLLAMQADATVIAAATHRGRHSRELLAFVRSRLASLNAAPSLFISVGDGLSGRWVEPPARILRRRQAFLAGAGWQPTLDISVAGALRYARYRPVRRKLVQVASAVLRRPTDTSRDHEFTHWPTVDAAADLLSGITRNPGPRYSNPGETP